MLGVLKAAYRKLNKPAFIIHREHKTFKVFMPKALASKQAEIDGNSAALAADFWEEDVIAVKPACFSLTMEKGFPLSMHSATRGETYMEQKLQQAFTYPTQAIAEAFDFKRLRNLEMYGLESGLLGFAEQVLHKINLPITSAHGDLHIDNLILLNNKIKVIDWSMFSAKGSFITDYMHFFNYRNALAHQESWTKSILRDDHYLDHLSSRSKSSANQLRLAYCISRISGEVNQAGNCGKVLPRQIKKYSYVLSTIAHAT